MTVRPPFSLFTALLACALALPFSYTTNAAPAETLTTAKLCAYKIQNICSSSSPMTAKSTT
jgi:hypothetical protein